MLHPARKHSLSRSIAVRVVVGALLLVGGFRLVLASKPPWSVLGIHAGTAPTGVPWRMHTVDDSEPGPDGVRLADANHDGLPDIATGWERAGLSRLYLHPGYDKVRQPWPAVTVGVTAKAEDAVLVDLDEDGALDVVTSTEGGDRRIYVQWAPKNPARLLEPEAWEQDHFPGVEYLTQWMFALPLDIDHEHGVDLVIGGKNDDWSVPTSLGWLESPPNPRDTAAWRWHPLHNEVSWVMSILAEDVNEDGHVDILYTDKHGPWAGIHWLENPGSRELLPGLWKQHTVAVTGLTETSFVTVADLDGDGRRDVLGSATLPAGTDGGGESATGDGGTASESNNLVFLRKLDGSGDHWEQHVIATPAGTGLPKGISVADVDLDGRSDLVVTCSSAIDALIGVYWLSWRNSPFEGVWDAHDISGPVGTKYDLVPLVDFDGDGDLDALSTEEKESDKRGLGVVWYENPTQSSAASVAVTASANR